MSAVWGFRWEVRMCGVYKTPRTGLGSWEVVLQPWWFTYFIVFDTPLFPMKLILQLFPFHRWGSWALDSLGNFPKIAWSSKWQIWMETCLMPWPTGHPISSLTGQSLNQWLSFSSCSMLPSVNWEQGSKPQAFHLLALGEERGWPSQRCLVFSQSWYPPSIGTQAERSWLLTILLLINSFAAHGRASQTCLHGGIP